MRTLTFGLAVAAAASLAHPSVARAAGPTERRLHSAQADASSFLWNDWNKFVENYHPNYALDDDPQTAWIEGADGSGQGEWLRIQITPLPGTTKVRLRVRNGDQKSKALFAANARARDVVVRLLPSKEETKATLLDQDGWQEIVVAQGGELGAEVSAIEVKVDSVYEGTKYRDLAISDLQIFATSTTPDNPAFEKHKHEELMAWRAVRLAAARAPIGQAALPIYPAYRTSPDGRSVPCTDACFDFPGIFVTAAADAAVGAEWQAALAIARALPADLAGLQPAQLAPRDRKALPVVDGLVRPVDVAALETSAYAPELRLPAFAGPSILVAEELRATEVKSPVTPAAYQRDTRPCKGATTTWMQQARSAEHTEADRLQVLVIGMCGKVEGREGFSIERDVQVLVYGADGRLALAATRGRLDLYRWTMDGERPMLAGGATIYDGEVHDVTRATAVARATP